MECHISESKEELIVNLVIERIPGFRDPAEFRLMFGAPGERPSLEHHIQGREDLLRFLQETLAQPENVVSRVVRELESSFGATTPSEACESLTVN
jgi:hypothetical protein